MNSKFKRIGTTTLVWDRLTWLPNWKLSRLVITTVTSLKKFRAARTRRRDKNWWEIGKIRVSGSYRYSCKQLLALIFFNFEVFINTQQIYNSNKLYAPKVYVPNNSKGANSEYKGVLHFKGFDSEDFPGDFWERFWPNFFPQRDWNCIVEPMAHVLWQKVTSPSFHF